MRRSISSRRSTRHQGGTFNRYGFAGSPLPQNPEAIAKLFIHLSILAD
ncbi:hypothetical protein [Oscillatoria sp. HE19RPO]|nr:hypothetical protein [Oscillatoria sp. HE19RPO]